MLNKSQWHNSSNSPAHCKSDFLDFFLSQKTCVIQSISGQSRAIHQLTHLDILTIFFQFKSLITSGDIFVVSQIKHTYMYPPRLIWERWNVEGKLYRTKDSRCIKWALPSFDLRIIQRHALANLISTTIDITQNMFNVLN